MPPKQGPCGDQGSQGLKKIARGDQGSQGLKETARGDQGSQGLKNPPLQEYATQTGSPNGVPKWRGSVSDFH